MYKTHFTIIKRKPILMLMLLLGSSLLAGGCGILDHHSESTVSSSLINYLYPGGDLDNSNLSADVPSVLPQISIPARVGIAFVPTNSRWNNPLNQKTQTDLLNKTKEQFAAYPFVQHIEVIPSNYLKVNGGFSNLEQVSRLYGVDIMALVSYDQVQKSSLRDSSFLYLTGVGTLVMKGDANQTHTFVDTSVFDVRSRKLLFRAPGTNQVAKNTTATDKHLEQERMALQSFDIAMQEMVLNLDQELSNFKERVKNEKVAKLTYKQSYSGGGGSTGILFIMFLGLMKLSFSVRAWK